MLNQLEQISCGKYVKISLSATGALVSAKPGKNIRVVAYTVVATAAGTVRFDSASTALTGAMSFGANGGASTAFCPIGLFETAKGEALNMTISGTGPIEGHLTYVEAE